MKTDNFNKIGDTAFRVKNQVNAYISFADWLITAEEKTDAAFKKWTKEAGIYDYGNDKINRLNMVLHNALFKYKVIKKINTDEYAWNIDQTNCKDDIVNNLASDDGLTKRGDIESCHAFKAMLDFMIAYPDCKDAERIFRAFAVYEDGDNFYELYKTNGLFRIIAKQKIPNGAGEKALLSNLFVRKPSEYLKNVCKRIVDDKKGFKITYVEFEKLKNSYLYSIKSKELFDSFVHDSSFDTIARELFAFSKAHLINDEYFDLFNRVLWGLDLSPAYGVKGVSFYHNENVHLDAGKYSVTSPVPPTTLPYTLTEINNRLKMIQNFDYGFMETDSHLACKPRADIAEYFVNMKFFLLFKISIKDIREFIHTGLDKALYPTSHAGRKISDMNYIIGEKLYSVETTIHKTNAEIIDHEFRGSIDHLDNHRSRKRDVILYLIQVRSSDPELVNYFTELGTFKLSKNGKKFTMFAYSFSEVADMTIK